MNCTIVVPTIREVSISSFLATWEEAFGHAHVIIIEDNPRRTFHVNQYANVDHYAWEDIDRELGERSWIIPRRTDCIRSYGFWKAYQDHPDMVVTLDDDCYPSGNAHDFLLKHWQAFGDCGSSEAWQETGKGVITRGVPYFQRQRAWPCIVNHGLWNRIPDFDAPTQLVQERRKEPFQGVDQVIPVGRYFPMCGMNLAFRPDVIPALYFLLMGQGYHYDRFGDIWSGIILKKICDHLGYAIRSGEPVVTHQRASNVWANLRKEASGLEVNEDFWQGIDRLCLSGTSFRECYQQLARSLPLKGRYWSTLREAMLIWSDLFASSDSQSDITLRHGPSHSKNLSIEPSRIP